jgi:succinyl-diaminopimelate desuccinylase
MHHLDIIRDLISFPSVTPQSAGAIEYIVGNLENMGFHCDVVTIGDVTNLYAQKGQGKRNLCFLGHVDVVPPGDLENWHSDPYVLTIKNDVVYGRGIVDMKGALGCYLEAVYKICSTVWDEDYTLSFLLTSDEEGKAENGIKKMVDWLEQSGKKIDHFLIGEPSSSERVGDVIRVGRRGSAHFEITIRGISGHSAYPEYIKNPIIEAVRIIELLGSYCFNDASDGFPASHMVCTNIEADGGKNYTASKAVFNVNIRFNPMQSEKRLREIIEGVVKSISKNYLINARVTALPFYCKDFKYIQMIKDAIKENVGISALGDRGGGTSDGRFVNHIAPVVELGLSNREAHHNNESCSLNDLRSLSEIYYRIIGKYFDK